MAIWRDPLDELIADLERVTPVGTVEAFEVPPPMEDYAVAVQSVLSRDPEERQRLAADPTVKRVMDYHERLARTWRSAGAVEPRVQRWSKGESGPGPFVCREYTARQLTALKAEHLAHRARRSGKCGNSMPPVLDGLPMGLAPP